jgi:hypothetical protein
MDAKEYNKLSDSDKKKEDWMNSKWRPAMGWLYMFVCFFDFVLAPILWSLVQALYKGGVNVQWQPLTLQGAGLFHISMGAVLGLAAYGRTQEKLNGANNGGVTLPANVGTTYTPPAPIQQPAAGGFSSPTPGFGAPTPGFNTPAPTGFGGSASVGTPAFGSPTSPIPAPASFPPANVSTSNIGASGFPKFSL